MREEFTDFSFYASKAFQDELLSRRGILCIDVGRSIFENAIPCYKIGVGAKSVIALGAQDASECVISCALYKFVEYVSINVARGVTYTNVDLQFLLQKFTFYIIPCVNPDGVALRHGLYEDNPLRARQKRISCGDFSVWRLNARGVMLENNYAYGFAERRRIELNQGRIEYPCGSTGEYPESEPESRALANFVRIISPTAVVSFHRDGDTLVYAPDEKRVLELGRRISKRIGCKECIVASESRRAFCGYVGHTLGITSLAVSLNLSNISLPGNESGYTFDCIQRTLLFLPSLL